ncbi:MAG: HAMP domain-containing sensor histidine kinase [Nannocystaceae bacterium]
MGNQDSHVDMEPTGMLQRWVDALIPERLLTGDSTGRLRARILVIASLALATVSALSLGIRVITTPFDLSIAVSFVDVAALAILPWLQRWTQSTRLAGVVLTITLVLSLPLIAAQNGFFPAPVLGFVNLVPVVACFFVGLRFAMVTAVVLGASVLLLGLLPGASEAQSAALHPTFTAVYALTPLTSAFLVAAYERIRQRNEAALNRRSAQLSQARAAAEEADRHKSEFLRHVSHELRTPLNAIVGYSELIGEELSALSSQGDEEVNAAISEDIGKIQGAGRLLLGLINDLLDISKIEAGALDLYFAAVDLVDLFEQVRDTVAPMAQAGGNTMVLIVDPDLGAVVTDGQRLSQILVNLCGNACKFTEGGTITLESGPHPRDPNRFQLSVRDTGVGMTPDQAARIFAPFVQVDDSMVRRRQGTGLGLMITKMLSERLGGEITVHSRPGEGSIFTVSMPREGAEISRY